MVSSYRERSAPINILTGIDYWLDNLMCNVPELAMVYHVNGVIKAFSFASLLISLQLLKLMLLGRTITLLVRV